MSAGTDLRTLRGRPYLPLPPYSIMDLLEGVSGDVVVREVEAVGEVVTWHLLRKWMLLSLIPLLGVLALEVAERQADASVKRIILLRNVV